jgi:RHS repeat-associated protein
MNRRTEKGTSGSQYGDKYLYDVDGSLLGTYHRTNGPFRGDSWAVNVYFAGRQVWRQQTEFNWSMPPLAVSPDRLGSTVKHFPYGDEPTTTAPNREKFATYYRDEVTALDYARNRYYSSTIARFTTADPYGPSARAGAPQTWNRYTYVGGDPVNFNDPSGLIALQPQPCPPGTLMTLGGTCTPWAPWSAYVSDPWDVVGGRVPLYMELVPDLVGVDGDGASFLGDMKAQAEWAVANVSEHCSRAFGGTRAAQQAYAQNMIFVDGHPGANGPNTVVSMFPYLKNYGGSSNYTFAEVTQYSYTTILEYPNDYRYKGAISNIVVIGAAFWDRSWTDQNTTLVHEFLHYYLNMGELALAGHLTGYAGNDAHEASLAISGWLRDDCPPKETP